MTHKRDQQWIGAAMRGCALAAGLGVILAISPASTEAEQVTCFTTLLPRGYVRECFALPSGDRDFELAPQTAAIYCARWAATGTVLPCPYATIAAEASDSRAEPALEESEDRANRWRRLRN